MTATTPKYQLVYPVDSDNINKLPSILRQQAESIETALSGFDFDGQDTEGLVRRVSSLETRITPLSQSTTKAVNYTRTDPLTMPASAYTAISNLSPAITSPDDVSYGNNAFKFNHDCMATISMNVTIKNQQVPYNTNERASITLLKNWSPPTAPPINARYGTANFLSEFSASSSYAGYFAAGDTITPAVMHTRAELVIVDCSFSISVQRVIHA
jgi:hypothetical protein